MIKTYSGLFLVLTGLSLSMGVKLSFHILKLDAQETNKGVRRSETMDRSKYFSITLYKLQDFQCFADGNIDVAVEI